MDTQSYFSKGYVQLLMTLVLAGAVVSLGAYAHLTLREAQGVYTGEANITVSGEGEVLAKPDLGQFSFSVRAEGDNASIAQERSAESINAILAFLEDEGVDEKDIKTQNYNLNPKYSYEERNCVNANYCPPGERVIDGYEVFQSVTIKVRDLENAGELISGAGERGATNISSLQFTIDDTDILKAEARELAIDDAKEKAEKLADDLGMRLNKITSFYEDEGGGYYPREYSVSDTSFGGEIEKAFVAPSLPAGENTIISRVNISYELR